MLLIKYFLSGFNLPKPNIPSSNEPSIPDEANIFDPFPFQPATPTSYVAPAAPAASPPATPFSQPAQTPQTSKIVYELYLFPLGRY